MVPPAVMAKDSLTFWRVNVLFAILFTALVLCTLAIVTAIFLAIKEKLWGLAIFDVLGYVICISLLLSRRLGYKVRATVTLLMFYIVGLAVIISVGPLSGGPAWLFVFAVLVGVLFGSKAAIVAIALNGITLTIIAWLLSTGQTGQAFPFFNTSQAMVSAGVNFIVLNVIAVMSVSVLVKGLVSSHQKEKCLSGSLEQERAHLIKAKERLEIEVEERKQAEEALRESEEKYRNIFSNAQVGIFRTRIRDGKVLECNDRFARMHGYENPQECIADFVASEHYTDLASREKMVASIMKKGQVNDIEACFSRKTREDVWIRFSAHAYPKEGYLEGVGYDITEEKTALEALRESEERFRVIATNTPDHILIQDKDLRYVWVLNPQSGFTEKDMIGKTDFDFLSREDAGILTEIKKRVLATGNPEFVKIPLVSFKGDVQHFEGSYIPKRDRGGKIDGLIGYFRKVTDRVKSEEALKESEERYRRILENVLVGVYQVTLDGKFIFANQKMLEIFGYSSYEELEAIGSFTELRARPEERPKIVNGIINKGFTNREVEFRHKDGHSIWIKLHARKAKNKEGAIILEGLMEDVTEVKKMESQLQQSQKMEAVGTLAGGIAHDFNNILAIILGNTELASDDVPDGNPASHSLKEIYKASIRAKDMVHQLLAFSRKTDEETKPMDLAPIIKESMKMLRSAIPTSVEFKQHILDDTSSVMGDATQINQIVMNLVTNAADAMSKEGGLLEVTLDNIILQEEKLCFDWVLSPGAYVRLKVRDTGEGIDSKIMDRIFEPYYTTKEVGKGTGMGLSVIHGIVKRHGGGIRVESELGGGTVFEIYFPVSEKTAEKEKEPEGEMKRGTERILFVDDEESLVDLNRQRLERLGYQVKSTTKPVEALEWFRADPDRFDVIITDMTMPQMTGDRLTAEVLNIRPHMPVIICSGYSEKISAKKAEGLGARKYIEKPIDYRNLASSLREVLEGK